MMHCVLPSTRQHKHKLFNWINSTVTDVSVREMVKDQGKPIEILLEGGIRLFIVILGTCIRLTFGNVCKALEMVEEAF